MRGIRRNAAQLRRYIMKKLKIINTTGGHLFEGEDYFPEKKLHGRNVTDKKHGLGIILSDYENQGWRIVIVNYDK